jgi:hypothetical protein
VKLAISMPNPMNPWLTFWALFAVRFGRNCTAGMDCTETAESESAACVEMVPRRRSSGVKLNFIVDGILKEKREKFM